MTTFASPTRSHCPNRTGTLMWVGERSRSEFRGVYATCESSVAQLALRSDVHDALSRPASHVAAIIVTRQTRTSPDPDDLQTLVETYPNATLIQVLGSLCEGERPRAIEPFGDCTIYWHQSNQFLAGWLYQCGVTPAENHKVLNSIAIVANSIQIADPLMELAASYGAAAFWCRQPSTFMARNFDAIWWDDSIATPTSTRQWQKRIEAMQSTSKRPVKHAWIVSCPRVEAVAAANAAGIDLVLSKPMNIEALLKTVAPVMASDQSPSLRRAA